MEILTFMEDLVLCTLCQINDLTYSKLIGTRYFFQLCLITLRFLLYALKHYDFLLYAFLQYAKKQNHQSDHKGGEGSKIKIPEKLTTWFMDETLS